MFATRFSTAAFSLPVMTTVIALGQVSNTSLPTAEFASGAKDGVLMLGAPGVRAFGDTYDLSLFWQCASDCDFVTDPGGGPDSCTGLSYDGVTESCGVNTLSGAGVEVLESETNNGDGTFTVIIQISSQNGSDLMPNGTECAPGQPINVLGAHLGCDIGCPPGTRAPCNSPSGGDELDPNLPDPPYELLQAKAVILGAGGQTLLEFDLATAGQTVNELGTQFTVGGVNGVQVTGLQFKFVIDVGEVTGACCESDGICTPGLTAVECATSGGTYQGDFTSCTPDLCHDCNGNGIPDAIEISKGLATDVNSNGVPDECEPDCNSNGIPDAFEISEGSATDVNTNGIPDICDILECRSYDLNHNNIPDESEIAAGTAADANTNGIIDEAEQPSTHHSFIELPGDDMRDDEFAEKLRALLINSNGTANAKDAKFLFAQCFGGGMLDDIERELGDDIPWVGGSGSRHDESSYGERDDAANPDEPLERWVRPLLDALTNGFFFRGLKKAARDDLANPLNRNTQTEQPQYRVSGPDGRLITLEDPDANSHHAVIIGGVPDGQRHRNDARRICEMLANEWGNLNTTGTSVHLAWGDGTDNPCNSSGVPDVNVMVASTNSICAIFDNLRPMLGDDEEFLLFVTDHGDVGVGDNATGARSAGGAVFSVGLDIPLGYFVAVRRDPFNPGPFVSVTASGAAYPPDTIGVTVHGEFVGYLDPTAVNDAGENVTILPIPEGMVREGVATIDVDATGAPGVIVGFMELRLGGINTIISPGWGDMDGDGDVDDDDMIEFVACAAGPTGGLLLPDCENADIDDNGHVDLLDYKLFQTVFTGVLP